MTDLQAARQFVQLHGRLLDRRRFEHLVDGGDADRVLAAVAAYANPDGGYAGVIEPDLRTTTSQPIAVLEAFGVLHEIDAPAGGATFDWLESIADGSGGIPFSLPSVADAPHAPWMATTEGPSLHMTAAVAAAALRLGAQHPWIEAATAFCRERIAALDGRSAYETKYAIDFLDATGDADEVERIRALVPADGRLPVAGGVEGETLKALDLAPRPDHLARRLVDEDQIGAELDELEAGQLDDGGWDVDFLKWSPVAAIEWRAKRTVEALALLRVNARVAAGRS